MSYSYWPGWTITETEVKLFQLLPTLLLEYVMQCNAEVDRLCGLVVSVEDYKHRGPGFDSRALLTIFLRELGLERGPLSLMIG
jgi:hypothetical protein